MKGNWERRAELALHRRLESKEKKAAKKSKAPTLPSIVHKLYSDDDLRNRVELYLRTPGEEPVQLCRRWFRFDSCGAKKCKYRHDDSFQTLSHVKNIDSVTNMDDSITTDIAVSAPIILGSCDLAPKDVESIRFIAVDGHLIYDAADSEVYKMWALCFYTNKSGMLAEGCEEDIAEDEVTDALASAALSGAGNISAATSPLSLFVKMAAKQHLFIRVLSYLTMDCSITHLMLACKQIKRSMLSIDAFRSQLREHQTSAKALRSREEKRDKKKKQKNAFISSDAKKDNFARGGNAC